MNLWRNEKDLLRKEIEIYDLCIHRKAMWCYVDHLEIQPTVFSSFYFPKKNRDHDESEKIFMNKLRAISPSFEQELIHPDRRKEIELEL